MSAHKRKCHNCGERTWATHSHADCIDALRARCEELEAERDNAEIDALRSRLAETEAALAKAAKALDFVMRESTTWNTAARVAAETALSDPIIAAALKEVKP